MPNGITAHERLIDVMYASVARDDWSSEFLAEACAATRSQAGAVVVADLANRRDCLPSFHGASNASALAYEALYSPMNPWRQATAIPSKAGDMLIADDLVSLSNLRQTQFWRDFLQPMDVDHAAGLVGMSNGAQAVSLTLLRSSRRGRYGRTEEAVLRPLGPHWANACAIRARFSMLHAHAHSLESALDRVATAVIVLDGDGKVLRTNAAASAMLGRGTFFHLRDGSIRTTASAYNSRLKKALAQTAVHSADGGAAPVAFLALPDVAQRHSAIAAIHALRPNATSGAAAAVLFVSEPSELQHPDLGDALSSLYQLTKAEVALCHALLSQHDFREASQTAGLRRSTARSRLQAVFGKTGTKGQADLMLLLTRLRSLAA